MKGSPEVREVPFAGLRQMSHSLVCGARDMSNRGAELNPTHQAIRDLASCNESTAVATLKETAGLARDQFLRRTAIEVIGCHRRGRELRAVILSALTDPSEYVVRTACDVVKQWELREAHDAIAHLLANTSSSTRISAI